MGNKNNNFNIYSLIYKIISLLKSYFGKQNSYVICSFKIFYSTFPNKTIVSN